MGNRIKELRVNANLTVRELSKITKIDYSYLSKIEKNDRNLTDEMALRIANFFSVDSGYVKGDNNYTITCYTNNLAQSICLTAFDIKHYGHCYTSKISLDNRIINILNRESEKKILNYGVKKKLLIRWTIGPQ